MSESGSNDIENPLVRRKKFLGIIEKDPASLTTGISIFTNVILSNIFLYGFTGNWRLSLLTSLFTIPFSVQSCLQDAMDDFKQWTKQQKLRERGVPERFLPYQCKYDWTGWEDRMKFTSEDIDENKE
uniref:ABC transmembrane type-1 domain-containing protein n=1 Tax=Strongyloides papillosus TaxID=174720 RepID=A0A0N5BQN0_STREA